MPVSKNIPQIDRCTHFVVKLEVWDAISMKLNCTISEGHLQYSYITSTAHATIKVSQQKTRISIMGETITSGVPNCIGNYDIVLEGHHCKPDKDVGQ